MSAPGRNGSAPLAWLAAATVILLGGLLAWSLLATGRVELVADAPAPAAAPDGAGSAAELALPVAAGEADDPAVARAAAAGEIEGEADPEAAADEPVEVRRVRVSGVVVDTDGLPVAGARVDLDVSKRSAVTAEDGTFSVPRARPGAARISVVAAGYAPTRRDGLLIPAEEDVRLEEPFVLRAGAVLAGRVVDATGAPVAGVEIAWLDPLESDFERAERRARPIATTPADGTFELDTLAPGPWRLLLTHSEHPDRVVAGIAEGPSRVQRDLVLRLAAGASIAGRVVAAPGAEPPDFEQLFVRAVRRGSWPRDPAGPPNVERDAACAADGSFRVSGLAPDGRYGLVVRRSRPRGKGTERASAEVRADAGAAGVELRLDPPSGLRFRVADSLTGAALEEFDARARVEDGAGTRQAETRARAEDLAREDGAWRLPLRVISTTRTVSLEVRAKGYESARAAGLSIAPGLEVDVGTIRLEPRPVLTVRVIDAVDGAPLPDAWIRFAPVRAERQRSKALSARADGEGMAEISGPPGLLGLVWAQHEDRAACAPVSAEIVGGAGVELALGPGGDLLALVTGPDGGPVPGARVIVRRVSDPSVEDGGWARSGTVDAITDASGEARFAGLYPMDHELWVDEGEAPRERGRIVPVRVAIVEGGEQVARLTARPRANVTGRVTSGGRPLAGATVRLIPGRDLDDAYEQRQSGSSARTGADGDFEFARRVVGDWVVVVDHPDRAAPWAERFELLSGGAHLEIELHWTTIEGVVVSGGEPLADAEVALHLASDERAVEKSVSPSSKSVRALATVRTGEDGAYRFEGVPHYAQLIVVGRSRGHQQRIRRVRLEPRGLKRVELSLARAARLRVQVTTATGDPAPREVRLTVRRLGEGDEESKWDDPGTYRRADRLDGRGRATFDGLAPGRWRVSLRCTWLGEPVERSRTVQARAGRWTEVDLELP